MSQVKRKTELFSPGPWSYRQCEAGFAILGMVDEKHGPSVIGSVPLHLEPNAALISSAPELVAILSTIEHSLRLGWEVSLTDLRKARKALKKAGVLK